LAEVLRTSSSEYELLAEWHADRAPLGKDHLEHREVHATQ